VAGSILGDRPVDGDGGIWIDDGGLLHVGRAWVALPDVEWRLVGALVARVGQLVRRDELVAATWPGRVIGDATLGPYIRRVRKRLQPLGITITTVRGRGFVLSVPA